MKNYGFTLTEIMVVLVVIGIITGILLPTAIQSMPDKNVMKFKKGYNTIGQVIRELVTSDKYYKDGDLGIKENGDIVNSATYFCETFAEIVNIKNKNCSETEDYLRAFVCDHWEKGSSGVEGQFIHDYDIQDIMDMHCKHNATTIGEEIVTNDGIVFYQTSPGTHYGRQTKHSIYDEEENEPCENQYYNCTISNKLYVHRLYIYKILCMDIDGIHSNTTSEDCINECPFGFGIRGDGKMILSRRSLEWLNKTIQKEE